MNEGNRKALIYGIALFYILLLSLTLYSPFFFRVKAQPHWLRKGVYARYRFRNAYTFEGAVGGGNYSWEVVDLKGVFAVLNVTFSCENFTRSLFVTINSETMDLVEDGEVWGKAYFWIDLTRLPSPYPDRMIVRNITLVMNWLNMTIENPRVSPIYSSSRTAPLYKPVSTGLGPVDKIVTLSKRINLTHLDVGGREMSFPLGFGISSSYDAKYGILLKMTYVDDILYQKFGIIWFDDISGKRGDYIRWIELEDTNLDLDIIEEGINIPVLLRRYYVHILFIVLAVIFAVASIRGMRRRGRY